MSQAPPPLRPATEPLPEAARAPVPAGPLKDTPENREWWFRVLREQAAERGAFSIFQLGQRQAMQRRHRQMLEPFRRIAAAWAKKSAQKAPAAPLEGEEQARRAFGAAVDQLWNTALDGEAWEAQWAEAGELGRVWRGLVRVDAAGAEMPGELALFGAEEGEE